FLPADFPQEKLDEILPLVFERLVKLRDIEDLTDFFYREVTVDPQLLLKKATPELVADQLTHTPSALESLSEWSVAAIEEAIRSLQAATGWSKGQYFMMVRVALTG